MTIGELSQRTGVPTRMLRYYEEQGLLHPERAANGYRCYGVAAVYRVQQIRGLLDSRLTTEIIRKILPFLDQPDQIHLHPDCMTPEVAGLLRREADRIQQRIDCLTRNRDAIHAYLAAVQPDRTADEFRSRAGSELAAHASEDERSITVTTTDGTTDASGTGQYAEVNGINLYFETHGAGRPLILLHGGLGSGEMFGPVLPALAERHQVIAVDLQGHGRTADIDRPIDVRLLADDIAALIEHLGLDKPDLVGYSLGGGVALHTAAKYPAKVGRLVVASAHIRPDAIYQEMRAQQGQVNAAAAEFMKDTPIYQLYQRVAPHPEDFPRLLDKIGESMSKDFDFTEEARGLQVPTLIVAADADMAPPSHYVEFFKLLDGGLRDGGWMGEGRPKGGHALAILPGLTHYNLAISPLFAAVTLAFLDG